MLLYGREALLAEVVGARSPLLVLQGDSGIGKSELLQAAQSYPDADTLSGSPVTVNSAEGAVYDAVLIGITDCLERLLTEDPWLEVRPAVTEFARRLLERGMANTGELIRLVVIGQLRERLGDDAVELLGAMADDVRQTVDSALRSRLAASSRPNERDELLKLALEVLQLSGREAIFIALDRLEVLCEADVRLLADLARHAPSGVVFRGAVMDTTDPGRHLVHLLQIAGGASVSSLIVDPLDEAAVRSMLNDNHLDLALAPELIRLTGGYPLQLGDAILDLRHGGRLSELTPNQTFEAVTERIWSTLDIQVTRTARQLCVLDHPLPVEQVSELLGMSEAEWWDLVDRLQRSRIFTQSVDGQPWFHEQRRRWLVEQLSAQEREATAARLIPTVRDLVTETPTLRFASMLADTVMLAGQANPDDDLRSLTLLDDAELALLGALIELYEASAPGIEAQALIGHTREAFLEHEDYRSALESLEASGRVAVAGNDNAVVVVPVLSTPLVVAASGICARRLGRAALPSLASTVMRSVVFQAARPELLAEFGVGHRPAGAVARDLRRAENSQSRSFVDFAGSVIYGQHRGTRLYAGISKSSAAEPAAAATTASEDLRDLKAEIGGGTFTVMSATTFPGERLPTLAWDIVATRILGREHSDRSRQPLPIADHMAMSASLTELARNYLSESHRWALGLDEPIHLFYEESPKGGHVIVRVTGLEAGATATHGLPSLQGPYHLLDIADHLGIGSAARVMQLNWSSDPARVHPLRELAKDMTERVRAFNAEQPKQIVDLAPAPMTAWLNDSAKELDEMMRSAASISGEDVPAGRRTVLVTGPAPPLYMIDLPPAMSATAGAETSVVTYEVADEWSEADWGREMLSTHINVDECDQRTQHASVTSALSDLTGFAEDDLTAFASAAELGLLRRTGRS